jgi:hypothetical protein
MTRSPLPAVQGLARTASLPPPPPRPAAAAQPPMEAVAEPRPAQLAQAMTARASESAQLIRNTTLSLPTAIVRQLKDRARADRTSQPEVIMDALSSVHHDLGKLLAEREQPVVSDGLFFRKSSRTGSSEPLATLSLRMLSSNIDAIDELVSLHQAPSRSALCLVALKAYLAT